MKNLSEYTDEELDKEQRRRSHKKKHEKEQAQKVCQHDVAGHLKIDSDHDDHSGRDQVTFRLSKFCKKCHKELENLRMITYTGEDDVSFKLGLEELCRKYGSVWDYRED